MNHQGQEVVFDFATKSADQDIIQFASFFGDCTHEVTEVTEGTRITLAYTICRKPVITNDDNNVNKNDNNNGVNNDNEGNNSIIFNNNI